MSRKLQEYTDEELASVSGQPGSIEDYRRTMEFKRRALSIDRAVACAQIKAANWTKWSAIAVAVSVVVTTIGIWFDLIGLQLHEGKSDLINNSRGSP
ncbi:hypothetical protein [Epibacterium ulvae]|uniref:hypothetical protein n=1 Tax=Epibacterium ulvae TaxID=1156985 RepID=UPI002491DDA5|nr:hypothetical protein [Epibacterium ulvae]